MDEQQQHSETTRPVPPASQPSSSGGAGTPNQPPAMVKRHRGRNIALIIAALVILGVVLWRWHPWGGPGGERERRSRRQRRERRQGRPRRPRRCHGQYAAAGSRGGRDAGRNAGSADRARHGYAAGQRHRAAAVERCVAGRVFQGGPDGQEGRRAGPDRPAPLSDLARQRARHARARRGAAANRPPRPEALSDAALARLHRPPAGGYAGLAGAAIRRHGEVRQGQHRHIQARPRVCAHHRAGVGTRRSAPGRSGQLRDA